MDLKTQFDGLTFKNPLMPASGPLSGDLEKLLYLYEQGIGALVSKTISSTAAKVPRPCIFGGNNYIMNSELWSEFSYEFWLENILGDLPKDLPTIISVGYSKEDMELLIPLLDSYADAFEVSTHYVGKDLRLIAETVKTIRKNTDKPVYMKISPHIPDPIGFAKAVRDAGATGIVAINSLGPTMNIDLNTRSIVYGNSDGFAWTSGPAIKNLALAIVYLIKEAMPDFTVIGVGGVSTADDVLQFLMAGASAVQMLSGALLKGKDLYGKIIADLPQALEKYGFNSIEEVKATALSKSVSYEPHAPICDHDVCTKCGLCQRICPYFAISLEESIEINEDKCFGCELCVSKCPVHALSKGG